MNAHEIDVELASREITLSSSKALAKSVTDSVQGCRGAVAAALANVPANTVPIRQSAPVTPIRRVDRAIPKAYQGSPKALIARPRMDPRLVSAARGKVPGNRYGALFLGPSGCGKSSVAAWALRQWRAVKGLPANSVAWLDAIEATDAERRYRLGSGDPEPLADAYRADWLVLDDVGLTCSATLVQLVLARRYQASLPTIVTTGLEPLQLVQHIGAATVRRIVEFEGDAGVMVDCHRGAQ